MRYLNMDYEYQKYVTDIDNLKNKLELYGVAIIPSVLNNEECKKINFGIWEFFEEISKDWSGDNIPINRYDVKTWRELYKLFPLHCQLFKGFKTGHAKVSWEVRQNLKIVKIFAKLWNCSVNDLLVSFDAFSFCLPPEVTKKGWDGKSWFHTDQSYLRNDFECIQSWVTANDVEDGDSTLAIMEGSHKYHKEFAEKFNCNDKSDWYKLNSIEEKFYEDKKCQYKRIKCPKGSLVLWDSRTIHYGCNPEKTRKNPNFRSVIYLCYMPKSFSTEKDIEKKKNAFYKKRTTNHWPCKANLVADRPNSYGKEIPEVLNPPEAELNELGKSLAGL